MAVSLAGSIFSLLLYFFYREKTLKAKNIEHKIYYGFGSIFWVILAVTAIHNAINGI